MPGLPGAFPGLGEFGSVGESGELADGGNGTVGKEFGSAPGYKYARRNRNP